MVKAVDWLTMDAREVEMQCIHNIARDVECAGFKGDSILSAVGRFSWFLMVIVNGWITLDISIATSNVNSLSTNSEFSDVR